MNEQQELFEDLVKIFREGGAVDPYRAAGYTVSKLEEKGYLSYRRRMFGNKYAIDGIVLS